MTFQRYYGFEFMEGLLAAMTAVDPAKRSTIEEVVENFSHIRNSLSGFKLRSLITRKDPTLTATFLRGAQALRAVQNIISRKPAIPDP
jgi:hypothetical protein